MSIIYSYPEQGVLNADDMLIGTSAEKVSGKQKNITRNFSIQQIADFINGKTGFIDPVATDFQIPVFNQSGTKITGSIMSQDIYPNGTGITISGSLATTGSISTPGNLTATGIITLGSNQNLISLNSQTRLNGPILDTTGTVGSLNQILLSDSTGVVRWQNYEAGLTYEGTWNATNNTTNGLANAPALISGQGTSGHFYIVNTGGNVDLDGNNSWSVGDWAIFLDEGSQPASWQKIDNTSALTGTGTDNKIAMWTGGDTPSVTLADSIISQDAGATAVTITGTVIPTTITDKDTLVGTAGQILSSTATGIEWIDNQVGTVTGTGTTNTLPIWFNGGSGTLGDSILNQAAAAGVFTDTHLSIQGSGGLSTQNLEINKALYDGNAAPGADGQVLTSSTQGADQEVRWVNASTIGDVYTFGSSPDPLVPANVRLDLDATTGSDSFVTLIGSGVAITQASDAVTFTVPAGDTYTLGSSTDGSNVKLNLDALAGSDSDVTLTGAGGLTVAQTNNIVTLTAPASSDTTYTLAAGAKTSSSVPLNLSPSTGSDTTVNLTEGTGITLTRNAAGDDVTITTTAAIGSFLPIGGGTLTGALSGTSAAFSTTVGATTFTGDLNGTINTLTTAVTQQPAVNNTTIATTAFANAAATAAAGVTSVNTANADLITIAGTGSGPYTGAVTATAKIAAVSSSSDNLATGTQIQTAITNSVASYLPLSGGTMTGVIDMGTDKITNVVNPTSAQDAATKQYVDDSVVGGLIYQGGYNASTNSPFLDSRGSQIAVSKGWTYTVTTDGTFYTETVKIGDVLIAEVDIAAGTGALTDWTTVQSNIDVASATVQGIANFPTGNNQLNIATGSVTAKTFGDGTSATSITGGYVPSASSAATGTFLSKTGSWAIPPNTGGTVTGTGAATQVTFWDGTSNVNGDTAFNWDNTNKRLGIGTNIPDKNLHVEGASAGVKIESTSSSLSSQLDLKSTTTTWSIGQNIFLGNTGTLEFYNGTAKLVVDTSGKVGIGVTTPDTLLHIMGASSGAYVASTINNTNVNGFVKQDFKIGTSHASISYAKGVFFAIGPDINDTTTPIVFRNNNAAERMRISSSGAIKFNAYGGGTNTGTAAYSLAVDSSGNIIEEAAGGDILGSGNGSSVTYFTGIIGDTGVKEITSNPNIVIDSTGRFGIGTDQPSHDLDVRNVISPPIINLQDANLNSLQLQVDPLSLTFNKIKSNINLVLDVDGYDAIKIDTAANVMIGDLNNTYGSATSRLHVIEEFATDILTLQSNQTNQKIKFTDFLQPVQNDCFIGSDNGDLNVWLNYNQLGVSTPLFSFNKAGALSIGHANLPNYNVDIRDQFNDANLQLMSQNTGQNLVLSASSSFGLDNTFDSGGGGLQFSTNGTNILNLGAGSQSGYVKFNEYGQGNKAGSGGTGVPAYSLLVDSVGEIIEGPVSSGGGTPVIIKESFSPFVGQINYDLNPLGVNNPQDENYVNIYIDGVYQNLNTIAGVNTSGVGASAMTTVTMVSGAPAGVTVEIVSTI